MILRSQIAVIRKAERRIKNKLKKDLNFLGVQCAKYIEEQETKWRKEDLQTIIDMNREKTRSRLEPDLQHLYVLWARYIRKAVEGSVDLSQINLLAVKRLQGLKFLGNTNIDDSIANYSFTRVKQVVADWAFDGKSYTEIGKDIREQTKAWVFSPARAERIAINMVGNAYEQWRHETMRWLTQQWYQVKKQWDTVGDSKVTAECRENEARGWLTFKEARPSGDTEAPRASNIRCRCTTNFDII